jgi:hypothetical protein
MRHAKGLFQDLSDWFFVLISAVRPLGFSMPCVTRIELEDRSVPARAKQAVQAARGTARRFWTELFFSAQLEFWPVQRVCVPVLYTGTQAFLGAAGLESLSIPPTMIADL